MENKEPQRTIVKYIPAPCTIREAKDEKTGKNKKIPATFKGHMNVFIPDFDERMNVFEELGIDSLTDEKMQDDMTKIMSSPKGLRKIVKMAPKFIESMELTRLSNGKVYKSWSDLTNDPKADEMIGSAAVPIIMGQAAGGDEGNG